MRVTGQCLDQSFRLTYDRTGILSFLQHFADRVEIYRSVQFFGIISFFLEIGVQQFGQLLCMSLASPEIKFYTFAADVFQQSIEVFCKVRMYSMFSWDALTLKPSESTPLFNISSALALASAGSSTVMSWRMNQVLSSFLFPLI